MHDYLQAHALLNVSHHSLLSPTGGPQADGDPAAAPGTANLSSPDTADSLVVYIPTTAIIKGKLLVLYY